MEYQIETVKASKVGMFLTFWGTATRIVNNDGRIFSKYYIVSKDQPTLPDGWTKEEFTYQTPLRVSLREGQTIDKVKDNLGNTYYEVKNG